MTRELRRVMGPVATALKTEWWRTLADHSMRTATVWRWTAGFVDVAAAAAAAIGELLLRRTNLWGVWMVFERQSSLVVASEQMRWKSVEKMKKNLLLQGERKK